MSLTSCPGSKLGSIELGRVLLFISEIGVEAFLGFLGVGVHCEGSLVVVVVLVVEVEERDGVEVLGDGLVGRVHLLLWVCKGEKEVLDLRLAEDLSGSS